MVLKPRGLFPVMIIILLCASGFIALTFYSDAQRLFGEKKKLVMENAELHREIEELKGQNAYLEKQYKECQERLRAADPAVSE